MNIKDIKAFAFDLDGTIVDSKLDFNQMRRDLDFPDNSPILEHLETIKDPKAYQNALDIINKHESIGAERALLISGVKQMLNKLKELGKPVGILTRNSKNIALISLKKFDLDFDIVLSRDCCKAKPDPEGLEIMAHKWGIKTSEMAFIGDHLFDMHTADAAESFAILYDPDYKVQSDKYLRVTDYNEFLKSL